MELLGIPVVVCLGGLVLVGALGIGAIVLVKLGVIAKYAVKEEPPDPGNYDLEQSHESDET
jgi:hypothetical protein